MYYITMLNIMIKSMISKCQPLVLKFYLLVNYYFIIKNQYSLIYQLKITISFRE